MRLLTIVALSFGSVATLSSCATARYAIERCTVIEAQQVCSKAEIRSRREFPKGLSFAYNPETGSFEFYTDETKNDNAYLTTIDKLVEKIK